jgi:hypothetical protein
LHPHLFDAGDTFVVPVGAKGGLNVSAVPGGAAASPSQTGLLLLYRDSKPKAEAEVIKFGK